MRKTTRIAMSALVMTLFAAAVPADEKPATATAGNGGEPAVGQVSVMDRPVDFSTPENVQKSLQAVREGAGNAAARDLNNALQYILTYDLSIGRDQAKLYKKLDGRTPRAIIAKIKR